MREFSSEEVTFIVKMFRRWNGMISRCNNAKRKEYDNYGGRGIKVFENWRKKGGFEEFFEYVQRLPHFGEEGYSLDRIDVNGNYEPGNVRWATMEKQCNNRRSNTFVEDLDGKLITLAMAAKKYGIKRNAICARYVRGERGEKLFRPFRNSIIVDGKTLNAWSKITGIGYDTLHRRYSKGERGERLFRKPEGNKRHHSTNKPILIDGKTLQQLSEETGVSKGTLRHRYKNGERGEILLRPLEENKSHKRKS